MNFLKLTSMLIPILSAGHFAFASGMIGASASASTSTETSKASSGTSSAKISILDSSSTKSDSKKKKSNKKKGSEVTRQSEVLFEGYSKVMSAGIQIGYTIIRYSFDNTTGHFKAQYFLKTGKSGNDISESYVAEADQNFAPISYQYTSLMPKETRTIDAVFSCGNMKAKVTVNGKTNNINKPIPKGAFLSTFLVYVMMKQPEGLQTNNKYEYKAIAEEDADVTSGTAFVEKVTKYGNFKTFKINNKFKDIVFLSYISDRGEVVATESPSVSISSELVAKAGDATNGFSANASSIKMIFGDVPLGTKNIAYETLLATETTKPSDLPSTDENRLLQKNNSKSNDGKKEESVEIKK